MLYLFTILSFHKLNDLKLSDKKKALDVNPFSFKVTEKISESNNTKRGKEQTIDKAIDLGLSLQTCQDVSGSRNKFKEDVILALKK